MSLKNRTITGFLWMSVTSGMSSVAKILVLAVLARLLSIESFGVISAALIIVSLASLITQMGIGPAIVQKKNLTDTDISMGFTISLVLGVITSVAVFFSSGIISEFFNMEDLIPVLKVFSSLFLIESISVISVSRMQRDMEFKKMSIISLTSYIVGYGFISITLAYFNFDLWALVYGQLAQTILKVLLYIYFKPFKYRLCYDRKVFKNLLNYGGGFTLAKFGNYLALQGDNLITGKFLGSESLGLYSRAYSFMVMPVSLIGTAMDQALFPAMSSIQNNHKKIGDIFYKGTGLISIVSVSLSIVIFILAPEIVNVLLGPGWEGVIRPLQILSVGLIFRMSYRISDSISKALALVYKRALIQFVYAFSVLLLTFSLKGYGINGIAMGVLISLFINFLLMSMLSITELKTKWSIFFGENLRGLRLGIVFIIVLYPLVEALRKVTDSSVLVIGASTITLGLITMLIFLYARQWFFNDLLNQFIENLIKKVRK